MQKFTRRLDNFNNYLQSYTLINPNMFGDAGETSSQGPLNVNGMTAVDMLHPEVDFSPNLKYEKTSLYFIPFYGHIHFIKEVAGVLQMSFIVFYWIFGMVQTNFVILLPLHWEGHPRAIYLITGKIMFFHFCFGFSWEPKSILK